MKRPASNGRPCINGGSKEQSEDEEEEEERGGLRAGSVSPRKSPSAPLAPRLPSPQTGGQERWEGGTRSPGEHQEPGSEEEDEEEEMRRSANPAHPHAETKVKRGEDEEDDEEKEEDEREEERRPEAPVIPALSPDRKSVV